MGSYYLTLEEVRLEDDVPPDGSYPHLVPVHSQRIQGSQNRELYRVVEKRSGFLCPHPQLLPSVLRLFKNQPRKQKTKLRNRLQDWRAVRWHSRLPDCRGYGRHGQRLQSRPQNDLLLRPRGLPDVQRDVESFHLHHQLLFYFISHTLLKKCIEKFLIILKSALHSMTTTPRVIFLHNKLVSSVHHVLFVYTSALKKFSLVWLHSLYKKC